MIKKNVILASISTLLTGLLIVTNAVAAVVFDVARATIPTFTLTPSFTYSYDGHTFNCYSATGGVAIAWGENPENAPSTINVPAEVEDESENPFKVVSVMAHGFRYCPSATINLPDTIEEIGAEAFAYCEGLTSFTLPCLVTEIPNSCFIDCRELVTFYYSNGAGIDNKTNKTPQYDGGGHLIYGSPLVLSNGLTTIGDHAFDSCVSLLTFNCPETLVDFGDCSFQNCDSFTRIFLPNKVDEDEDGVADNQISIGTYSFANCDNLVWLYFEENLVGVDKYAFVDCHEDMVLHYGCKGSYPGDATIDGRYTTNWRKEYLQNSGSHIPIEVDYIQIYQSKEYPGLRYTIDNRDIYLDGTNKTGNDRIKIYDASANLNVDYAVIYEWNAPSTTIEGYYNVGTQALEIPGTLTFDGNTYDLKVIKAETFKNHMDISSVKFNHGLIQICNKAFYNTPNIANLDFTACDTLIEISSGIFNDYYSQTANNNVTVLHLPNSVEYVGSYAFYNFRKVTTIDFKANNSGSGNLKVLGGYSFGRIGEFYDGPKVTITLPCTLNDAEAKKAELNKRRTSGAPVTEYNNKSYDDYNEINWAAIGPYAFGAGQDAHWSCVKYVIMEKCNHAHATDMDYTCSLASNAFNRAKYLTKFRGNENLCMIGNEAFKNCTELREVFLTTTKAIYKYTNKGVNYPWGTKNDNGSAYEQSIFYDTNKKGMPNLVIYLDGESDDIGLINSINSGDKTRWNSEGFKMYQTQIGTYNDNETYCHTRSHIPTFENVDFDNDADSVLYWNPDAQDWWDSEPTEASEYDAGVISFVKVGVDGSSNPLYAVGRYYTNSDNAVDEIDLTGKTFTTPGPITKGTTDISNHLIEIGPEAFAHNGSEAHGRYFILPHTIKTIRERAFFRRSGNNDIDLFNSGTRIVTFITSGGTTPEGSSSSTYSDTKTTFSSANNNDKKKNATGYCVLPASVERIERDAFYCNKFGSVEFKGSNLTFLGNNAFYSHTASDKTYIRSRLSTITFTSNSYFSYESAGFYYKGTGKKTLLYQTQNNTGTLSIASDTVAIGYGACAATGYSEITFNTSLTTIYGEAFANNVSLQTVNVNSNLEYICAINPTSEVYDDSTDDYFDNYDNRDVLNQNTKVNNSRTSAFHNCVKLETFDFTKLTNLKKIGHSAFRSCSKLDKMAGNNKYKFYDYNNGSLNIKTGDVEANAENGVGVLDLRQCTSLVSLGKECFYGCSQIKFCLTPPSNGQLYVTSDPDGQCANGEGKVFNNDVFTLVGDVADKACTVSSDTHAPSGHWSNQWVNGKQTNVYYYAASDADVFNPTTYGSLASVKYWTTLSDENGFKRFLLFSNPTDALTYLP